MDALKIFPTVTVDVSTITMKRDTYVQIRIPTKQQDVYEILEIAVDDKGWVWLTATEPICKLEIERFED